MRHFILGTAGHVDHGKTELVKALTGKDTDRLRAEKERGISIELGFAPLDLGDVFIGIIDVPGHERFVKKMVAGAGGIDLAMLLVAADEGVMPQTREHLEVLKSLGISRGLVVMSKWDLASPGTEDILGKEIVELVRGSFLEGEPVVATSAKTGIGLGELKRALRRICMEVGEREGEGPFRLPVDRVFLKEGIGVVVTGSCYSGEVRVGDRLMLQPGEKPVRIRAIQSFGQRLERGKAGERLALALQGVKSGEVSRGDVLATPAFFPVSTVVDASLYLASYADFSLKNRERVRVHHCAREVLGRVLLLDREQLAAGQRALVQLRLEQPLVAAEGDRFVVRKYSPPQVIGGGVVLVPRARKHRRFDRQTMDDLSTLASGDSCQRFLKELKSRGLRGMLLKEAAKEVEALTAKGEAVVVEELVFARSCLEEAAAKALSVVREFSSAHPILRGVGREELRQKMSFPHPPALFNRILALLCRYAPLEVAGERVGEKGTEPDRELEGELSALEAMIKESGLCFLTFSQLESRWRGRVRLSEALQRLREEGRLLKAGEGFVHRDSIERCREVIIMLLRRKGEISVGDFKETFGLTRKHAIPLLELLDEMKLTRRRGDVRVGGERLEGGGQGAQGER